MLIFMISSIIQPLSNIKIYPSMSEQEKKRQRIYDLLNAETKPFFSTEKGVFKEKWEWKIEQKWKCFLTSLGTVLKGDPTTLTRKHANELKVLETTVKTAI